MKKLMLTTIALMIAATAGIGYQQDEGKKRVEQPVKKQVADKGKKKVERKIKGAIKSDRPDVGKKMVEMKIKETIKKDDSGFAPGKVKWHASFDRAIEAAKKSGKPVLLFQLLGNLNEEFC